MKMTAERLIENEIKHRTENGLNVPRYAVYHSPLTGEHDAVAAWDEAQGRWVAVAGLLITGKWCAWKTEIVVNGDPLFRPDCWHEYPDPQQAEREAVAVQERGLWEG